MNLVEEDDGFIQYLFVRIQSYMSLIRGPLSIGTDRDLVDESENEESGSCHDESEDEEPRIKDVLSNVSQAVPKERVSGLLHSIFTSRDILFWTPRGRILRNKSIILVTNIAELVEYVLLPHNDDVTKPRSLNTFLDGRAELRVDKGLIKSKKVISDLVKKKTTKMERILP